MAESNRIAHLLFWKNPQPLLLLFLAVQYGIFSVFRFPDYLLSSIRHTWTTYYRAYCCWKRSLGIYVDFDDISSEGLRFSLILLFIQNINNNPSRSFDGPLLRNHHFEIDHFEATHFSKWKNSGKCPFPRSLSYRSVFRNDPFFQSDLFSEVTPLFWNDRFHSDLLFLESPIFKVFFYFIDYQKKIFEIIFRNYPFPKSRSYSKWPISRSDLSLIFRITIKYYIS